jgi:hypothetical protein
LLCNCSHNITHALTFTITTIMHIVLFIALQCYDILAGCCELFARESKYSNVALLYICCFRRYKSPPPILALDP